MTSPSEAARLLSRARWGDQRVRTLLTELSARRAELTTEQRDELRRVAGNEETSR